MEKVLAFYLVKMLRCSPMLKFKHILKNFYETIKSSWKTLCPENDLPINQSIQNEWDLPIIRLKLSACLVNASYAWIRLRKAI